MTCPSCDADTDSSLRSCSSCGEPLPVSPGWVIANRYDIQARLGEGGMGAVFRARDRALHVTVAFKVLRLKADPTAVRRFHHEVTLARKVRHENVCAVYEYGEDQGILYCTMELVEGTNLRQVLRQAPLAVDQAYGVALKAAAGLRAIHEAGVVHRDLKTSNIMIDGKDQVRLVDFGIAKAMPSPENEPPTTDTPLTGPESVVGTPAYMSPEQVMGWPLDARSDIYSFGIVLFELFSGQLPFQGSSRAAVLRRHLEEPPPLHGALAETLPTALVPVLERALAKDPDLRYRDAAEMIRDLERARDSLQTDTMHGPPAPPPARWLLAICALVAGVALFVPMTARAPESARPGPSTIPTTSASIADPSPTRGLPAASPAAPPSAPASAPPSTPPTRRLQKPRSTPPPMSSPSSPTTTTTVPPTTLPAPPISMTARALDVPTIVPSKPLETPPVCLSCPPPKYPPAAERYGLEGTVELEISVDEKGNVAAIRVLRGDSAFRAAAQKAVRAWRFVAAKRDGVPIAATLTKIVEFRQNPP